jgi:hypothetical protein
VAFNIAWATCSSAREPLMMVKVPWQLITGLTPMLSNVGTCELDLVLVLGVMKFSFAGLVNNRVTLAWLEGGQVELR